jgi:tetratricopeptide (TPR) repeat protein
VDAYALYLEARELFIKREHLLESIRLFHEAIALDAGFARAWEGLAAVEIVTDDWVFGDGVFHAPLALEAANSALALDPDLSMPFAVIGLYAANWDSNPIEAKRNYNIALLKDPKNTSAMLWRGILFNSLGFFDDAIRSFEQCLDVDPGYLNCAHHMSLAYLHKGMQARALEIYEPTLEQNFHSASEAFVSYYAMNGQRNLALLLADIQFGLKATPVVDWIRALEDPDADHSAGLARLRQWESQTDSGITLADLSIVLLSFGAYEEFAGSRASGFYLWVPDASDFRTTPYFKSVIRDTGALRYWQEKGFPDFCRPVGDDDFACDELDQ